MSRKGCKVNNTCGCNKSKVFNNCGCNNNMADNDCCECLKYKELANEKCEQAACLSNKAIRVAQQAKAAEDRAEALKQQAIDECRRANELWDEYQNLSNQGLQLMKDAQQCLAKSVECYQDCYKDEYGCNLEDFGYDPNQVESDENNNECNCNCNCNWDCD